MHRAFGAAAVVSLVLLAGCGGDDDDADASEAQETTSTTAPTTTTTAAPATHTVVGGDTLSGIATQYATTVAALVELNALTNPDVLEVGQVLQLPVAATTTTAAP